MNDMGLPPGVDAPSHAVPNGYFVIVPQTQAPAQSDDSVDLAAIVSLVIKEWKLIVGLAVLLGVISSVVAFELPNTYKAKAVIALVIPDDSAGGGLRSQLSGVAALAGLDIGSAAARREEQVATLLSASFARDFILSQNLMPVLFFDRWDTRTKQWRSDKKPPTLEAGVRKFMERVRSISEDKKTGLVTVHVEWYSPELAARWTNQLVEMVNDRLRLEAVRDAGRSVEYLNKELSKTNVVGIQQGIYRLIEQQVNNAMLANVREEYAFRFIDRAVPPDIKYGPKRSLITLFGCLFGTILGLGVVKLRHTARRFRKVK